MESDEALKMEIRNAAVACVPGIGIENVTFSQVAEKAGISVGDIEKYFPEIFSLRMEAAGAYIRNVCQSFGKLYEAKNIGDCTGLKRLQEFFRNIKTNFQQDPQKALLFVEMNAFRIRRGGRRGQPLGDDLFMRRLVAQCIERGQEDGSIRSSLDPLETSAMIGLCFGQLTERVHCIYHYSHEEKPLEHVMGSIDEFINATIEFLRA